MVRPEFRVALRGAISKAKKEGITISSEAIRFKHNGQPGNARLEVYPLRKVPGQKQNFLAVFKDTPRTTRGSRRTAASRLEQELATTREFLRTLIAEHETVLEEMRAASEESLANNEELQTTNEELETAKEELQSSNEELTTLNEELRQRNDELEILGNDLTNLLLGVQIPVLVLDRRLHIRRFTPLAGKLLNLIESDAGRPFPLLHLRLRANTGPTGGAAA